MAIVISTFLSMLIIALLYVYRKIKQVRRLKNCTYKCSDNFKEIFIRQLGRYRTYWWVVFWVLFLFSPKLGETVDAPN